MNVTDDGIDASRPLFFCLYDHEGLEKQIETMMINPP